MTEIKDETTVEAKLFGSAVCEQIAAYHTTISQASAVLSEAFNRADNPLNVAKRAVRELLPNRDNTSGMATGVNDLLTALSMRTRTGHRQEAQEAYDAACAEAERVRDEALSADPFTKFVSTYIANTYGQSYADTFYEAMPLSYDGLKELAIAEDWCGDFEMAMHRAVRDGALPGDWVTITRSVQYSEVTSTYNAQPGETWTATFRVRPYVRHTDSAGYPRSFQSLVSFASDITFERVDKPEETDAAQS